MPSLAPYTKKRTLFWREVFQNPMELIVLTLKLRDSAKKLVKMPCFALKTSIKAPNFRNSIVRWPQKRNQNQTQQLFSPMFTVFK